MADHEKSIAPLVSIIIPCYNYGNYLPETIESLQGQNFDNWECLVIDDGSTDNTSVVVKEISFRDQRIKYFSHSNSGQPAARNNGIQNSKGSFIQFLDADDLLEENKISSQLNYLHQHPEIDIAYGPVNYFKTDNPRKFLKNRWDEETKEWMPRLSGQGYPLVEGFVRQNILELGCALFRRDAIQTTGLFNLAMQGVEDYEYCFRAATKNLFFAYVEDDHSRCLMRHHPESFSKNLFHMFKKELLLRHAMDKELRHLGFRDLLLLNKSRYASRLRRLQEMVIDETIKGKKNHMNTSDMKWIYYNSSFRQNLFFFPRIFKAFITGHVLNNR